MKTNMALIKLIFCAGDQAETEHTLTASAGGEVVATCSCGRFLKFPAGITREEFDELLAKHKLQNVGQVTQESIESTLSALADEVVE